MTSLADNPVAIRTRLLREVPPFRPVALQLLKLIGQPNVPLAQIVSLMRTDAVMTAEMLRLANSPLLDCRNEIKSVLHALAILGLNRVSALILTTAMRGLVDTRRSVLTHLCWRHSLTTALVCERLAEHFDLEKETAYTAGLIHDIGRLALLRTFPEYEEAMKLAEAEQRGLLETERQEFHLDHAEAGRWLLGQWGCPMELQNVAALHECPPAGPLRDAALIRLVHAGSQLADAIGMSPFPASPHPEPPEIAAAFPAAQALRVLAQFPQTAEQVITKVNQIELSLC
ncbi:MAG TPA: HDOD domain-containing protein [Bryobacteraceae bacterium]|nr:HDOD domain-containing protein [Bryobacteraceae bacterium]